MDAALMARVFFDLQKKSLDNFFDAWAISQGLATKTVRIWARQMGIGETGRGYGDRWQRIIDQEQGLSRKPLDGDLKSVKNTSKNPKIIQPASVTETGGDTRWTPPQGAANGCYGPCAFPPK